MALPGSNRVWCMSALGIVFIVTGAVLPIVISGIDRAVINDLMTLDPSSQMFSAWQDPPIPLYMKFYFYNVMNKEEILKGGKPQVVQIGPYTYREHMPRENVTWNDNNTVTYVQPQTYIFDRSLSVGDENDTFTSINLPLVTLSYMMKDMPGLVQKMMEGMILASKEELFIELSVKDLLWGYPEPLFKLLQPLVGKSFIPSDHFGFLMGRNNSGVGTFTVFTGADDKSKLNMVDVWAGKKKLDFWNSHEANMINGTDGTMYHPFAQRDEIKYIFTPDMCRSMPYIYEKDVEYKGITLWHFPLAKYAYANGTDYPPNQGFCTPNCHPSGLLDVSACRSGAPMQLSNPHFYDGDPILAESIGGLNPSRKLHENYMDLEPLMGMPWRFAERLQLNIFVEKMENIKQTGDIRTLYFPVLWFEESVVVTDDIVAMYTDGFIIPGIVCGILKYVFVAVGGVLVISVVVILIRRRRSKKIVRVTNPNIQTKTGHSEKTPLLS